MVARQQRVGEEEGRREHTEQEAQPQPWHSPEQEDWQVAQLQGLIVVWFGSWVGWLLCCVVLCCVV